MRQARASGNDRSVRYTLRTAARTPCPSRPIVSENLKWRVYLTRPPVDLGQARKNLERPLLLAPPRAGAGLGLGWG